MGNGIKAPAYVIRWKSSDGARFPTEDVTISKFRADLYDEILRCARNYSQKELKAMFEEPQPRISELLHGRIDGNSVEKLTYYSSRLGSEIRPTFQRRLAEGDSI